MLNQQGTKQQSGNKTPQSDSSIEAESNQKTTKEGSTIQTNTGNSQSSSAGKVNNGNNQQQISSFQQSQQHSQIYQQSQSGKEGGNSYSNNSLGLERMVNQSLNSLVSSHDAANGTIPNTLNSYLNNQYNSIQQNGSQQQIQQNIQIQRQQQYKSNKTQAPFQNSISNNGNSNKNFHVIVTEDDSEVSASCENLDDNKSNVGMNSYINNQNQNQNNNSINNLNSNIMINNENNLNAGSNGPVSNNLGGIDQMKRKTKQKKNKENTQNMSKTLNQPNLSESNSSNIEVISTEGKHSIKQTQSRINQNNPILNNMISNSSAAKVSFIPIPRNSSNQTNQQIQQDIQQANQASKQSSQTEIGSKKILIQHSQSNNNVIQLCRKNNEDTTLLNTAIPLGQQNSFQNLEESSNRQIEQQQQQQQPAQQNNAFPKNIQQIQIKQSGISVPSQSNHPQMLNNNYNNNSQHHHQQIVNPQALPHALPPTHNMINIPSQINTSTNNNNFNNINMNNDINNNNNIINNNNHNNSNNKSNNTNNNENLNNSENNNNKININNSNNNGNYGEQTLNNEQQNDVKKKKKRKNIGKAESHTLQQQQMIGQYQKQQIATPNSQSQQRAISIQHDLQEELIFNQNSNMSNLPQSIQYSNIQQKYTQQTQKGLNSPASNSNTFTQNLMGSFNSNGINGSQNFGQQKTKQKNDVGIDQDQENDLESQEQTKIGVPPSISLGISNSQQLIREQSNAKQNYNKLSKNSRKNDFEYKQRMKKGPLNLNTFEDQPTLFLRLSDYQEQQKKEKEEVIENHLEELNESIHSQNGLNVVQINQNLIFPVQNTTNSFLGATYIQPQLSSTKPLLAFKLNNIKQEYEKLEVNSQDNDNQPQNGNNKTPTIINSSNGQNTQKRSRIKKFDNSALLDKTFIIQEKITKKFKNSHYPESFKEAFSPLHSDFASTYLDPSYCNKIVSFFNHQQDFNRAIDKEEVEIDY